MFKFATKCPPPVKLYEGICEFVTTAKGGLTVAEIRFFYFVLLSLATSFKEEVTTLTGEYEQGEIDGIEHYASRLTKSKFTFNLLPKANLKPVEYSSSLPWSDIMHPVNVAIRQLVPQDATPTAIGEFVSKLFGNTEGIKVAVNDIKRLKPSAYTILTKQYMFTDAFSLGTSDSKIDIVSKQDLFATTEALVLDALDSFGILEEPVALPRFNLITSKAKAPDTVNGWTVNDVTAEAIRAGGVPEEPSWNDLAKGSILMAVETGNRRTVGKEYKVTEVAMTGMIYVTDDYGSAYNSDIATRKRDFKLISNPTKPTEEELPF